MSSQTPDSFFEKQGNATEVAERAEPDQVYLSEDSEPEDTQPEEGFATGAPGFASMSAIHHSFQNPAFQSRHEEIITTPQTVITPEEDTSSNWGK